MAGACTASDNPGFPVNSFTLFAQVGPRVGSDGSGNFVVVWGDFSAYDPAGWEVLGQRFDRTTLPIGAPFRVSAVTLGF